MEGTRILKRSSFLVFLGLRFGAIQSLKWKELEYSNDLHSWYFYFIDPKPQRPVKHFISQQAVDLPGDRKEGNDLVFPDLNYSRTRDKLRTWCKVSFQSCSLSQDDMKLVFINFFYDNYY